MLSSNRGTMHPIKIYNLSLILFFLVLFSVPVYWVIPKESNQQALSLIEARSLEEFSNTGGNLETEVTEVIRKEPKNAIEKIFDRYVGQFLNRSLQTVIEKSASDGFPQRLSAISLSKAIDRVIINLVYGNFRDPAIPADMQSGLYVMRDKSFIIREPSKYDESIRKIIDDRIENYKLIISEHPNIDFFLFYYEQLEFSAYHPLNQFFKDSDRGQSFLYFEKNIPPGFIFGKKLLSSYEEHTKYYYRTDHHWNIHGALLAYDGIYELLAQNYPEISLPLKHDDLITFPGIEFLGAFARKTLYPIRAEKFEVLRFELPPYKIFVNGQESAYNKSIQYLAGNYSTVPYTNHYGEYFGEPEALVEYVVDNNSNRNLLIIGNSCSRPLQPMLAYHYHHTYNIDLREYKDFSLSKFLSNYQVDDILILAGNVVGFTNDQWIINP